MTSTKTTYHPSKWLFTYAILLLTLSLGSFLWPSLVNFIWTVLACCFATLVIIDLLLLLRSSIEIRSCNYPSQATVNLPCKITYSLGLNQPLKAPLRIISKDSPAFSSQVKQVIQEKTSQLEWTCLPQIRGDQTWPGFQIKSISPLKLIVKRQWTPPITFKVYPQLREPVEKSLNPPFHMELAGLKYSRLLKGGHEFESLRPYVEGDNYRHIDWNATARLQTPITRNFQVEHHHNIVICLDTSRRMGIKTQGISKLDRAIEAVIHLAFTATRFEDHVELLIFSEGVDRRVKAGSRIVQSFIESIYNVQTQPVDPNFDDICTYILTHQRKRSLVIFLSDFLDSGGIELFLPAFHQLGQKHAALFIGLEDPFYQALIDNTKAKTSKDFSKKVVGLDHHHHRQNIQQQLKQQGLQTCSSRPDDIVQQAMSAYLDMKFSGVV